MNWVWRRLNSRPKRSVHVFTFPYLGEHADAQRAFSDFEFAGTIASTHHDAALMILQPY